MSNLELSSSVEIPVSTSQSPFFKNISIASWTPQTQSAVTHFAFQIYEIPTFKNANDLTKSVRKYPKRNYLYQHKTNTSLNLGQNTRRRMVCIVISSYIWTHHFTYFTWTLLYSFTICYFEPLIKQVPSLANSSSRIANQTHYFTEWRE